MCGACVIVTERRSCDPRDARVEGEPPFSPPLPPPPPECNSTTVCSGFPSTLVPNTCEPTEPLDRRLLPTLPLQRGKLVALARLRQRLRLPAARRAVQGTAGGTGALVRGQPIGSFVEH